MSREVHVRFCERRGAKLPPATHPGASPRSEDPLRTTANGAPGELGLPAGAVQVNSDPASGGLLSGPAFVPASGNLVDLHDWWTVPGEPQAVEASIEAHPPAGLQPLYVGNRLWRFDPLVPRVSRR